MQDPLQLVCVTEMVYLCVHRIYICVYSMCLCVCVCVCVCVCGVWCVCV